MFSTDLTLESAPDQAFFCDSKVMRRKLADLELGGMKGHWDWLREDYGQGEVPELQCTLALMCEWTSPAWQGLRTCLSDRR